MPIVVADETSFPLADLPKHVPARRGGKKLHVATAFRWAKTGVRGVRLETIRVGGTLCTSVEALQRFFERLSATDDAPTPADPAPLGGRSAAARQRDLARAERAAEALGV